MATTTRNKKQYRNENTDDKPEGFESVRDASIDALMDADAAFVVTARLEDDGVAVSVSRVMRESIDRDEKLALADSLGRATVEHGPEPLGMPAGLDDLLARIMGESGGQASLGDGEEDVMFY